MKNCKVISNVTKIVLSVRYKFKSSLSVSEKASLGMLFLIGLNENNKVQLYRNIGSVKDTGQSNHMIFSGWGVDYK
jgi:hypothetical protein